MSKPLIGISPRDTFDKVDGVIDLLCAVDYSGIGFTESAKIGHLAILDLMQHALRFEVERF